jgi:UMF1 family MFS transporter
MKWRAGPLIGWALYDFANTIFSFAVITRYFNAWYIEEQNRPDIEVGIMGFAVGILLIIAMPAIGAISDQVQRRLPFLAVFTTICLAATVSLGFTDSPLQALITAGVAIFAYQLALSMYDPLLAVVAPPGRQGLASGIGVGAGYIGVLIGSVILTWYVAGPGNDDLQSSFIPTAILFGIFAIPIFVLVREPRPTKSSNHQYGTLVRNAIGQVVDTTKHIRDQHANTGRFLIARFLYVDAIATVIGYMTVYTERVGGFTDSSITVLLGLSMISAALGAFAAGALVERLGPKTVLNAILLVATFTLIAAGTTGSSTIVWALGPLVGITLGTVWTSDRLIMMRLTPPPLRGEFFAIYNLVGKLSSGVGPLLLWGGTIWLLHSRGDWSVLSASRVALIVLAFAVVAGLLVLRKVEVPDRDIADEPNGLDPGPTLNAH